VHLRAVRQREHRGQQADGAGAADQDPLAGPQRRAPDRAQGAAARLDQRPRDLVDVTGQRMQRGDRHGQLLGQRAGEPAPDAHLAAVLAHMVPAAPAALARAAAQHGVAGGAPAQPARIDAVADGADRPGPLMPEPQRVRGVALLQVSHLAGKELDVGAAYADPLDVDNHLPRRWPRVLDLGDLAPARAGDHERSHAAAGGGAPWPRPGRRWWPEARSRVGCGDISRS
jgi:hypothetical protein